MSRGSVREYVEALRERYRRAGRRDKGRMLDEFTQVTGYHRKAAIRLLRRGPRPPCIVGRCAELIECFLLAATLVIAWQNGVLAETAFEFCPTLWTERYFDLLAVAHL